MVPRRYVCHIVLGFALWTVAVVIFFSPLDPSFIKHSPIPRPQVVADHTAGYEDDSQNLAPEFKPEFNPGSEPELKQESEEELTLPSDEEFGPESKPKSGAFLSEQKPLDPPFTGAFKRFPRLSDLAPQQRRLSVIAVWDGDDNPGYLRHFLHGIQRNADVLDLLLINRKLPAKSKCLDFEETKLNITWGGNIKVVCMDDADWKRRHVDYICGEKYGWNCNATEYKEVTREFAKRPDKKNYDWRPFRGYAARDLLQHPENPFWAWMDLDVIPGNFQRYPFNLISQLSFLTGDSSLPGTFFLLMGQLTAFNYEDEAIATAWKKFPEMKSPAHFTKYIDGKMPNAPEEKYWSHGYVNSEPGRPGDDLSWGIYPDIHGDDFFDMQWSKSNATQTFVVSGRDILLVNTSYAREEIETLIHIERSAPIDDLGGVGWSAGDGALVTEEVLHTNCSSTNPRRKHCVERHPLTVSEPPVFRPSWVHFKDQAPNTVWRRLELDTRPRGYERKLIRHHLFSKKQSWWEFPPFEITDELVYRYNFDSSEVWRMGPTRDETLFYRKQGEESIG